ncbi:endolytic transglycosylase MltG [Danxiaibacter flavus]|uniref:Endolytic murein transglycosylase n=1 Tax=Danxiaibacter flavus TaxID=3049108 RepID=A0ABV3ZBC8_9BACT|nr:endolytic transglycosylase MltG [Chitinophagaceae bacterium DXS]
MKKTIRYILIALVVLGALFAWMILGSATTFSEKSKYIYIKDGADAKSQVLQQLEEKNIVRNRWLFSIMANRLQVWDKLKPGRFEIKKSQSLLNIVRTFRNNTQSPVKLVINKLRTQEELAKIIGKNFSADSADVMRFISNNDSLKNLGVDTNTLMTIIIPDTYNFNWNTSVRRILQRLQSEKDNFWDKNNRLQKAQNLHLSPEQVYIIASIVEEETNMNEEKGKIASVYINRYNKGMMLGADPTIKFALKDFSLKRLYYGHLDVKSPYNTYRNKGLPPGPICTPSPVTIDAVLDSPQTDYLFFVAESDFSGRHHFSSNYAEHEQYAKLYQQALNERMNKQQNK